MQFVIANPENQRFKGFENQMHPRSPSGKLYALLAKKLKLDIKFYGSFSEYDAGFLEDMFETTYEPTITCHSSFKDFIWAEM